MLRLAISIGLQIKEKIVALNKSAEYGAMIRALAHTTPELKCIFDDPFAHHFMGPRTIGPFYASRLEYALSGISA